jgi:hypothetical protein
MVRSSHDGDGYNRVLKWLIENKDDPSKIAKAGRTKNSKWWFMVKRPESFSIGEFRQRLVHYRSLGFSIPKLGAHQDVQLVGEAFEGEQRNFCCTSEECDGMIDFSTMEPHRQLVMNYHPQIKGLADHE